MDLNTRPIGRASNAPVAFTRIEFIAVFRCSSVAFAARARSLAVPREAATPVRAAMPVPTATGAPA